MISKTKLQNSKLPKMLGELMHSNQFMKMFSFYALTLSLVTMLALAVVATKEPTVLTLDPKAHVLDEGEIPKPEDQISVAIRAYLEKRYKWEPKNVINKLKDSEAFIMPSTLKAFREAVSKIAKFSTEKIVTQTVYPEAIRVDLQRKTALVTGDRVTSIQGMKAAGDLKLVLSFESGSRTKENPWGIYIVKETEE